MQVLMVQGTTSDAGKSTLVAGLCRVFADAGVNVAPFKPQNMALNSAVTDDGGEIGRAQALQAVAAKVPTQVDFNPILLKPNSDTGAQVIIHGRAISNMEAQTYHDYKTVAMEAVLESHQRLARAFDLLMVEGAGSPAEINLRENDIANMGYAEAVDCPVIIIADIDKGGVFAHLVGTLELLSETEQARVKGFVINRFRGDMSLLQSGLDWLEQKTGKPVLGVLPYVHDLSLDAEDAISLANPVEQAKVCIAVLLLPHISNHTDFDSLRLHPEVDLQYIRMGEAIPATDLVIIPGSKNVIADLAFLKQQQWQVQLNQHLRYGGKVLGICGGFQMLGQYINDPLSIESSQGSIQGLQLAEFSTELTIEKSLTQVSARVNTQALFESSSPTASLNQVTGSTVDKGTGHIAIHGYEIHCGYSTGDALSSPFVTFSEHPQGRLQDGFISDDKQIVGTYLHGLFDDTQATLSMLQWVSGKQEISSAINLAEHRETQLNRFADICREHLDIEQIRQIYQRFNAHD